MIDARGGGCGNFRLGVICDAKAGLHDHVEVIRAIADGHGLFFGKSEFLPQLYQRSAFAVASEDRLGDFARELVAVHNCE